MASMQDFYNLPKSQQAGIIGALFLVVALGVMYWAWQGLNRLGPDPQVPTFLRRPGEADSVWVKIDAANVEIDRLNAYIAKEEMINAKLESLQEEIIAAGRFLPKEKEKEQVRELIQKYMRDVPADYGQVRYVKCSIVERGGGSSSRRGAATKGEEFQAIVYQTEIQASMEGLISFIDAIETSSERFMIVERFSIEPGEVWVDESVLDLAYQPHTIGLDIVTYVYKEGGQ